MKKYSDDKELFWEGLVRDLDRNDPVIDSLINAAKTRYNEPPCGTGWGLYLQAAKRIQELKNELDGVE